MVISLQTTFSLASNVTLFDLADRMQKCVNSCKSSAEVCQLLGSQRRIFRGKTAALWEDPTHIVRQDLRWKCKASRAQTKERPSQSLFLAWVLSQRPLCTCVFLYVCMHVQTHAHIHPESCTQALKTPGPWHATPSISFIQC